MDFGIVFIWTKTWKLLESVIFSTGLIHAGPTCMRCNEVAEIGECLTNVVTCGDNEVKPVYHKYTQGTIDWLKIV